ncbi:MAG: hypothetical protein JSW10_03170, partial [Pseudomonadota bacterium]
KPSRVVTGTVAQHASPATFSRQLRGDLESVVMKALQKAPMSRYGSAADLGDDIQRYLGHRPVLARRATPVYPLLRFIGRNRASALAVLLGIAALSGALLYQDMTHTPDPEVQAIVASRIAAGSVGGLPSL